MSILFSILIAVAQLAAPQVAQPASAAAEPVAAKPEAAERAAAPAALTLVITKHKKSRNGPAKVIEAAGFYRRVKGERLKFIRIVALDANGRLVSAAKGRLQRKAKTWTAGVGDFRMVYYYVEWTVRNRRLKKTFTGRTATYRW